MIDRCQKAVIFVLESILLYYTYIEVNQMPEKTAKFTVRTNSALLKKFRYVAEFNARSANKEIEVLMKQHVAAFEKEYNKIDLSEQ